MTVPTHQPRDPHADDLVAAVARAAGAVTGTHCPEAELLALYAERELAPDERAAIEAHVASCGRCQATVAAFVIGAPESAGPAVDLAATVPWWAGWRWMVPLASATAVLAVAVWIGRGPAEQMASAPAPAAEVAASAPPTQALQRMREDAPATKADASADGRRPAQRFPAGSVRAALPPDVGAAATSGRDSAKNSADARIDALAVDERRELSAKAETDQSETSRQRRSAGLTQEPPAAAAEPAAAPAAQAAAPAVVGLATEAPVATAAPARALAGAGGRLADGAQSSARALGWRLRDGMVERSTDQGKTWTRTTSPTPVRLVSVSATDARSAVVATDAGARFATSDGGASWRQLP
jgi:Putative zinc-finger